MGLAIVFSDGLGNIPRMSPIGERIRALRKARKLTQIQLAERLAIDQSTLSDIERGAGFSAVTLVALCQALSASAQFIMYGGTEEELRETELLSCYRALASEEERDHLLAVARALAAATIRPARKPPAARTTTPKTVA